MLLGKCLSTERHIQHTKYIIYTHISLFKSIICFVSYISDIILQLSDRTIPAHRFVLNARSTQWNQSDENLLSTESLDLTHLTPYVASILIRWVYTDTIILPQEQSAIIELLSATNKYRLNELKEK